VHIVNAATGEVITRFKAYDENLPDSSSYLGGVRVATGDVTGDGVDEIITVPGRNYKPLVRIWRQDGFLLDEFLAYPATFTGGVELALGDVNYDGQKDIVTAMSYNGNEVASSRIPPTPACRPPCRRRTTSAQQPPSLRFAAFSPYGTAFKGGHRRSRQHGDRNGTAWAI
jgi:hypothetical protein